MYSREASGNMEKDIYFSITWARRPPLTPVTSQEVRLSSDIAWFELYQFNTDRKKAVSLFGDEISNILLQFDVAAVGRPSEISSAGYACKKAPPQ